MRIKPTYGREFQVKLKDNWNILLFTCKNVPGKRLSMIICVTNIIQYLFSVLFAVWYRTEPIKLDMFQKSWFSRKRERKWSLVRTVIRILWGKVCKEPRVSTPLGCHFSCDAVMTTVNIPDAHRSLWAALSLSRHLCQESPGLRDSKARS